jgi:hypothetical protein
MSFLSLSTPVFFPSHRQEALVSYRLHPLARRVASPSWMLEHLPLLHLRHGSTAAGLAATRAQRAVTAPVCTRAQRRAVAGRAGRGRPGKPWAACATQAEAKLGHTRAAQADCAGTVQLGRSGFGPVIVELFFLFSEYIQIPANLKICVGFI